MLTEREKDGVRKLLQKVPAHELIQLANTVTNRLIAVQNKEEAVKAISLYTESADQFLRRKLVKRDLLFSYLADNDIQVSPSADKNRIIQEILTFWSSTSTQHLVHGMHDENPCDESPCSSQEPVSDSSQDLFTLSQETPEASPSSSQESEKNASWTQELAVQFSSWFFTQLNLLYPFTCSGDGGSEWGPQHFLRDAYLKLCVVHGASRSVDSYDGAELVARRLGCLVTDERLVFNPNLTPEGTRGCSEPHGLVMVAVCGTIHKCDTCVGIFEQNFGLVRDPLAENNWKIKFINLQIKTGHSTQAPTLPGPSAELQAIAR